MCPHAARAPVLTGGDASPRFRAFSRPCLACACLARSAAHARTPEPPLTTTPADTPPPWADAPLTARLVLADGTVISGLGLGATGSAVGEVCFNTAMTGYQEILTDPSYAGQIITFT